MELNSYSLLIRTKKNLNCVVACILQTDTKEASNYTQKAGKALVSKIAAAGTVGGVTGLVSAFGTAGTGTAISTLSGAAGSSATVAWIGGIVGGGVFAGSVLTGGLMVVVGFGTYKLLSPKAREYAALTKEEREIVDISILTIRYAEEQIKKTYFPSKVEMSELLNKSIKPLYGLMLEHRKLITSNLNVANKLAFDRKAIPQCRDCLLYTSPSPRD